MEITHTVGQELPSFYVDFVGYLPHVQAHSVLQLPPPRGFPGCILMYHTCGEGHN